MSDHLFPLLSEFDKLDATGMIGFSIWLGRYQDAIPDVSFQWRQVMPQRKLKQH